MRQVKQKVFIYLGLGSQVGQTNGDSNQPKEGAAGGSLVPAEVQVSVFTQMCPSFNGGVELNVVSHGLLTRIG